MKQSEAYGLSAQKTSDKIFGPDTKAEYVLVDEGGFITKLGKVESKKELEHIVNEEIQEWAEQGDMPYFVEYTLFEIPEKIISDFEDGDQAVKLVKDGFDEDDYVIHVDVPNVICEKEPESDDHIHKWVATYEEEGGLKENPGVFGHGGGVIIREHCEYYDCSWTKKTDTWAQNPANGTQGHETVEYMEVRE